MISYRQPIALDIPVLVSYEKLLFPYSPWNSAQFKEEFAGIPSTRFMSVAESENTIIGYCGVFLPAPGVEADVLTVAVLPEYRRQGIAKEFIRQIEDWSKERGASAMMLEVEHTNESAIELYKSLGYMKISVRMDYYGPGKDAFVMRKDFA
ncbi:ribosomal-protein-alanine N-acetyltransferase [Actinobacteria bacterium IMCC25003]|nr:ribosomal-protein-alanine N-acetyltransferase [Actinobacteria bacterium IMCC25003]